MMCCAAVSLLGLGVTFCFVEDKRGARMEGEEGGCAVSCASESEAPQRQPPPQSGGGGTLPVVGLH